MTLLKKSQSKLLGPTLGDIKWSTASIRSRVGQLNALACLDDLWAKTFSTTSRVRAPRENSGAGWPNRKRIRVSMSSPMIVLRNVEKYFEHGPTKTFVLRRINAEIKEGEFVSIMGPSGAGKSTLLHLLGMHDSACTADAYPLDHSLQ